jgi:outer membrane protein TolC
VQGRELEAKLGWRQLAPDFFATASVGGAYAPSITDVSGPFVIDPYNRFGIGMFVGIKWDPDLFRKLAQTSRLEAQAESTRQSRLAALAGIDVEVRTAYHEVAGKRAVVAAYQEAFRAADAWLKQSWFQYSQGLAEFAEVEDPLKQFYQVAGARLKAILELQVAQANLAIKCGSDQFAAWPIGTSVVE